MSQRVMGIAVLVALLLGGTAASSALGFGSYVASLFAEPVVLNVTRGGAVRGGTITHVTTLDDDGPGSLRAALEVERPNVIVFDVAGEIALESDLRIGNDHTTIAGQTAPAPGIHLTGATLRVRADDVVVEHITIRPGMEAEPAERADGLTIGGGDDPVERIRIRNVSLSWSKDELAAVARPTEGPVAIMNSIFAEALRDAGHPKGEHSMGLLVRDGPAGVLVEGNLFVSNAHRNPVVAREARALVTNNWIVNPRYNALHVYLKGADESLQVRFERNVVTPGGNTDPDLEPFNRPDSDRVAETGALIAGADNVEVPLSALRLDRAIEAPLGQVPAANVPAYVLRHAGARPADRDAVDTRIVGEVVRGEAKLIDRPPQEVEVAEARRPVEPIAQPFGKLPERITRVEMWLEHLHVELGGRPAFPISRLN